MESPDATDQETGLRARLVVLPGMGNFPTVFGPLSRALDAIGVRNQIAPAPGFGLGEDDIWLRSPDAAVDLLIKEIASLCYEEPTIVAAHSLSGLIVLAHHRELPAAGFIGICCTLQSVVDDLLRFPRLPGWHDVALAWTVLGSVAKLPQAARSLIVANPPLRQALLWPLLAHPESVKASTLAEGLAGVGSLSSLAVYLRPAVARQLAWWNDPPRHLALIHAGSDRLMTASDRELASQLKDRGVYTTSIDGAGHWLPIESPALLAANISEAAGALSH